MSAGHQTASIANAAGTLRQKAASSTWPEICMDRELNMSCRIMLTSVQRDLLHVRNQWIHAAHLPVLYFYLQSPLSLIPSLDQFTIHAHTLWRFLQLEGEEGDLRRPLGARASWSGPWMLTAGMALLTQLPDQAARRLRTPSPRAPPAAPP